MEKNCVQKKGKRLSVQVLVATMNQTNHELINKMNIQTDAIIGNQTNFNSVECFRDNNHEYQYYNFNERGVGLNRNNTLMRATGDICLFADDDLVYVDDYETIVLEAFRNNPKADVIVFNLYDDVDSGRYIIKKKTRVRFYNYLRYGTARIAVRRKAITDNSIYFNLNFGGGTEHRHGEDNIFLNACLKSNLRIIALPNYIATLKHDRPSTWNVGYDQKYFHDQGALYRALSKKWWRLLCFQDAVRHSKEYDQNWLRTFYLMTTKGC